MSPREATQTDPMHRLGLTSAYEALEMAGYVPNRTPSTRPDRIGTFYGQTSDDWRDTNAAQKVDTYFVTGGVRAFAPVSSSSHGIDDSATAEKTLGKDKLSLQIQWAKLQHRHSMLFQYGRSTAGLYFLVGRRLRYRSHRRPERDDKFRYLCRP